MVEAKVDFDFEITLLTVRHSDGKGGTQTSFVRPLVTARRRWRLSRVLAATGHVDRGLKRHKRWLRPSKALGGWGLFGVELFVCGDEVIFSEVSQDRMIPVW